MTRDDAYVAGVPAAPTFWQTVIEPQSSSITLIDGAHAKAMASRRTLADMAERDRAHGNAGDARAYMYKEAKERHQNRLAAPLSISAICTDGQGNLAATRARLCRGSLLPASTRYCTGRHLFAGSNLAASRARLARSCRQLRLRYRVRPSKSRKTFIGDTAFNRLISGPGRHRAG